MEGGETYKGVLLDLPTLIEGHKTIDYKTLIKSADISQILYVSENDVPHPNPYIDGIIYIYIYILYK